MNNTVFVAGVGMIPFVKPGAGADPYPVMLAARAAHLALDDAGVNYRQIQQAYVGYVYGDFHLRPAGGSLRNRHDRDSYLQCQQQLFDRFHGALPDGGGQWETGAIKSTLALGFEQMAPGALNYVFNDRPAPLEHFTDEAQRTSGQRAGTHGHPALRQRRSGNTRNATAPAPRRSPRSPRRAGAIRAAQRAGHLPPAGHGGGGAGLARGLRRA